MNLKEINIHAHRKGSVQNCHKRGRIGFVQMRSVDEIARRVCENSLHIQSINGFIRHGLEIQVDTGVAIARETRTCEHG
jgi:hypothetical protein